MTVQRNNVFAGAMSALVLVLLAGCKPDLDPRGAAERADAATQRSSPAGSAASAADRRSGEAADTRTVSMGAAPAAALPPSVPGALPPPVGGSEPDPQITAGVKARLAADTELRELRIDVDTRDGVVTLSGSVPTAAVRARAGEIAHAVKGVRRVNDQLTLASG